MQMKREKALKDKVADAAKLVDWISKHISSALYDSEVSGVDLKDTNGWKALSDAMGDGYLASYREEFDYRDMEDDVLFPEEFNNASKSTDNGKV